MGIAFMTLSMVVYTLHVTCQDIDGGATEADGGASAPVGPSVATPLAGIGDTNVTCTVPVAIVYKEIYSIAAAWHTLIS